MVSLLVSVPNDAFGYIREIGEIVENEACGYVVFCDDKEDVSEIDFTGGAGGGRWLVGDPYFCFSFDFLPS